MPARGKKAVYHPVSFDVEPLEKATMTAVLFADPAPAKTAVSLHQTGQKGALGPASQAACHEARRPDPGPRTVCRLQVLQTGYWHGGLQIHTPPRVFLLERSGEMSGICKPQVQLPDGRAGPRHLIDTKPHLVFKLGWKEPGGAIPWEALMLSRTSRPPPSPFIHCASKLSCVPRG